jgi:hypothetical protein
MSNLRLGTSTHTTPILGGRRRHTSRAFYLTVGAVCGALLVLAALGARELLG